MSNIIGVRNNNTIVPYAAGSNMPAGTIISYSGSIAGFTSTAVADSTTLIHKDGWAVCNGASIPFATYAQLYARLSTTWNAATNPLTGSAQSAPADTATNFRIPNLQGVFLRGVADYAGADAYSTDNDVTLAAYKVDQAQGHDHEMTAAASGPSSTIDVWVRQAFDVNTYARTAFNVFDMVSDGVNGAPRIGKETNPKQVGVYYLVKLYDNLASVDVYIAPASASAAGLLNYYAELPATSFSSVTGTGSGAATAKFYATRIGNTITVTARIPVGTGASGTLTTSADLPVAYRPTQDIWSANGEPFIGGGIVKYFRVGSDGVITCYNFDVAAKAVAAFPNAVYVFSCSYQFGSLT
jgi:microcystin-dependent protein